MQSHLDELKKLKPIEENNSKELEKFADILERAVITLRENGRESDLESGTLRAIILEKIPERLLAQYYRWIKENHYNDSLERLKDWVAEEAEYQIQASEVKNGISLDSERRKERRHRSFFNKDDSKKDYDPCSGCAGSHPIWKCNYFRRQLIDEKWKIAKRAGLCYRCLGKDHLGKSCARSRQCNINGCKETHHRLLHGQRKVNPKCLSQDGKFTEKTALKQQQSEEENSQDRTLGTEGDGVKRATTMKTSTDQDTKKVALHTIPVILKNGSQKVRVNCLLDKGSDTTYINEDVVEELGLTGVKKRIEVKVANDQTISFMSNTFTIGLESTDGRVDTEIVAKTSEKICGGMKAVNWLTIKQNWSHMKEIPFPKLAKGNKIDVLLGGDHYELMYSMKEVVGKDDDPVARLCPLGWTAVGKIRQRGNIGHHHVGFSNTLQIHTDERTTTEVPDEGSDLNYTLKRFWDIETIAITPTRESTMTPEEKVAWEKVSTSLKFDGKHYEVAVPWKEDRPNLPDNLPMAKQRLLSTEKKLFKNKEVAVAYQQVLQDYLEKQYIRRVPKDEERPQQEWLLPHFPVIRPERASTKVRIVFDGSAPYEGKSLNTEALPGPKLQSNVFDILVKFRKGTVALAGDISQMYNQLVLRADDRALHRFLWRDLDTTKEPEVYEFLRFVFGGCYCPFCVQYAWQNYAQDHKETYPLAADAVGNNCYMDDIMPSVDSVEVAKEARRQLSEMGDKAGFHICKWVSNRKEVLEDVPVKDRSSNVSLEKNELPTTKTLGIRWDAGDDELLFDYSSPTEDFQYTKRNVLKRTVSLFDPLGLLSPFIIQAKIYLQQAWVEASDWDEELPDKLKNEWKSWFKELHFLREIKVPRCLKKRSPVTSVTLHSFSDASEKAYAVVVYSRHEYEGGSVTTRLVASKTRFAPLKAVSIPRLELMGAMIAVRLTTQISLALEIPMKDTTFWVDSMNVLHWIHGRSRDFKPFVSHRVGEIHDQTCPDQWRYVPTQLNPADFGLRGMTVSQLKSCPQWWFGPEFLKKPDKGAWPEKKIQPEPNLATIKEMKVEARNQESRVTHEQSTSFTATTRRTTITEHGSFTIFEVV